MTRWGLELTLLDFSKLMILESWLDLEIQIDQHFLRLHFGLKSFLCLNVSFYSPLYLTSDPETVPERKLSF